MSSGPTMTGSTCIEATKRKYINIHVSREEFCGYKGECKIVDVLIDPERLCMLCRYRYELDIPEMLLNHLNSKKENKCKE